MTQADSALPRRALPADPRSASSPDASPLDPPQHRPSRAIWSTFDDEDEGAVTPVPPPAPVLPDAETFAGSRRHRFSDSPSTEAAYVPRRSAASVTSPSDLDYPATETRPEFVPTLPPPPHAPDRGQKAKAPGFWADKKQRVRALAVVGAAVLALVAGLVLTNLPAGPIAPGASVTATADPSSPDPAQLVTADEAAALTGSGTWSIVDTVTAPTASSPQPLCLPATPESQQAATNRQARRLTATPSGDTLLQLHEIYPTPEDAAAAFASRLPQLGSCAGSTVLVTDNTTVTGLADEAATATVLLQEAQAESHTVLVARTGRFLDIVDLGTPGKAVSAADLAKAVSASLARQCGVATGMCPATVKAKGVVAATAGELGWLVENDLPRITPGAGRWGATTAAAPNLVGSQCEAVDLNLIPKATESLHRTYLLADDSAAPSGFGVDEAVYTFASDTEATALVKKMGANFDTCRTRTRTATVTALDPVKATGADGTKRTVQGYTVVQRISATKNVTFRVAVAAIGTRVVYLLANPSDGFDFSDAQWSEVGSRAAERASQF